MLRSLCSQLAEGTERKAAKKGKTGARSADDTWPDVHEEAFSYSRVPWPPDVSGIKDFISREAEVIFLANRLFPAPPGEWHFFDANHSIERALRWPPSINSKTKKASPLKNPWKLCAPTFTAGAKIGARKLHQVEGSNEVSFLEIKRVHPLEQMRMNGWDLSFWAGGLSPFSDTVSPETVADLAGNMWNGWSYMAAEIAVAGCCDWVKARRLTDEVRMKEREAADKVKVDKLELGGESVSGDDDDSESVCDRVPDAEVMPWDAQSDED